MRKQENSQNLPSTFLSMLWQFSDPTSPPSDRVSLSSGSGLGPGKDASGSINTGEDASLQVSLFVQLLHSSQFLKLIDLFIHFTSWSQPPSFSLSPTFTNSCPHNLLLFSSEKVTCPLGPPCPGTSSHSNLMFQCLKSRWLGYGIHGSVAWVPRDVLSPLHH